jgi:hypothetical protein
MSSSFHRRAPCTQKTRAGVILDPVSTVATLAADRAFNVFGDHSYRMDLRG